MLLANNANPIALTIAIWSLRSVPISFLILMFVFNSGSIPAPDPNLHFWLDVSAIAGIIGIIVYWSRQQRLQQWNVSLVIYLYIFLVLFLRNPFEILTAVSLGNIATIDRQSVLHSFWVALGIFGVGMTLEVLIVHLRQAKIWAWWLALLLSIAYVSSIVFFFSGTLGIWSLLDSDTKQMFKHAAREQQRNRSVS
jgi:hypothetical protein